MTNNDSAAPAAASGSALAPGRANVIGLGLIGGSIALGLRQLGWHVTGEDADHTVIEQAVERSIVDAIGIDPGADITFVAVPVLDAAAAVNKALDATTGVVTDVGSVKGPLCAEVEHDRFVGGHPMAGSERSGIDGADADLFRGAVWVLTPRPDTPDATMAAAASVAGALGAEVVGLTPERHDEVVAVVSHVPHLTAASLMRLASGRATEHAALLRLAAGGFRDMTRVASGHPDIWIDICAQNRTAITAALGALVDELSAVRDQIAAEDHDGLLARLTEARSARSNLPSRVTRPEVLAEVRIPIPDRAGAAAEVFTLAADLGVNIASFEVVHRAESNRGVAVVIIDRANSDLFRGGLLARGFRPAIEELS